MDDPADPIGTSSDSDRPKGGDSGAADTSPERQGAGCLPAVLAATLLMGMIFFIVFGFSAWLIFQKRGDLAVRTLRQTVIPELEQSRLEPAEKQRVIGELSALADDIEQGMYENWQAGGIMNRLITSPMMRWGDLIAVDRWAAKNLPPDQQQDARQQISRFFRAAELGRVVARDIHDVLAPVSLREDRSGFVQLQEVLTADGVLEVVHRARLVAERAEVPDQMFDEVSLATFVRRQIEIGSRDGAT